MTDDNTAAPAAAIEAAPSPATAAPETPAAPKPAEPAKAMTFEEAAEAVDFSQMTDAEFAAFEKGDLSGLGGGAAKPAKAEEPEDQPAQEPAGPRQAALTAQTAEELAAAGAQLGGRISIKALKPEDRARTVQALDLIRAGKAPGEAFAEVFGITSQPATAPAKGEQPEAEKPAAAPAPSAPNVAEMESQLAVIQAKYKEAKENYDPAASDILEQMTDLKMDLREARRDHAVKEAAWNQQQQASHMRALDEFSEFLTDPDSKFTELCDDEILLAEAKNDPMIFQPDWPEKIGRRVIDKFFKGKAAKSAEPEEDASQTVPPAPRQSVRLPGSPVGPGFSAGALSPLTAMAELDKLTPEQQDAFIQSLDTLTSAKPLTVHSLR